MTSDDRKRILLLSTSTVFGGGPLDYAKDEITHFLDGVAEILFVPFALMDCDRSFQRIHDQLAKMRFEVRSLHNAPDKLKAIESAKAIFVGGGNTFRLLKALYDFDLMEVIRERVFHGMPYMGSSAGSNIAGPTIKTTNDMPIVQPRSFDSLGLVPFQISPHFLDPDPNSTHMGETQEERILQFLEENETPVVGIREGAWVRAGSGTVVLGGSRGARIFRRGE